MVCYDPAASRTIDDDFILHPRMFGSAPAGGVRGRARSPRRSAARGRRRRGAATADLR